MQLSCSSHGKHELKFECVSRVLSFWFPLKVAERVPLNMTYLPAREAPLPLSTVERQPRSASRWHIQELPAKWEFKILKSQATGARNKDTEPEESESRPCEARSLVETTAGSGRCGCGQRILPKVASCISARQKPGNRTRIP